MILLHEFVLLCSEFLNCEYKQHILVCRVTHECNILWWIEILLDFYKKLINISLQHLNCYWILTFQYLKVFTCIYASVQIVNDKGTKQRYFIRGSMMAKVVLIFCSAFHCEACRYFIQLKIYNFVWFIFQSQTDRRRSSSYQPSLLAVKE